MHRPDPSSRDLRTGARWGAGEASGTSAARDLLAVIGERGRSQELILDWLGHELRNPLAAIQLAVAALRRGEPLESSLAILERQTDKLSTAIQQLLEAARALAVSEDVSGHEERSRQIRRTPARRTLLLVEDNEDLHQLLFDLIASWGLHVIGARDGESAIHLALTHRPDVALIDIGLPLVGGFEVASALREQLGTRILLLAMSGYEQADDRSRAVDAGFDDYLVKPVAPAALRTLVVGDEQRRRRPRGRRGRGQSARRPRTGRHND